MDGGSHELSVLDNVERLEVICPVVWLSVVVEVCVMVGTYFTVRGVV